METFADTWIETGKQIGLQQGLQQGSTKFIIAYLEFRFGKLDENIKERLYALPLAKLDRLQGVTFTFNKLDDLSEWMDKEAI